MHRLHRTLAALALTVAPVAIACGDTGSGRPDTADAADVTTDSGIGSEVGDDTSLDTAPDRDAGDALDVGDADDTSGGPLVVRLVAPRHAEVGAQVVLSASASPEASSWEWGLPDAASVDDEGGRVTVTWDEPGRYRVTARALFGSSTSNASALVTIVPQRVFEPRRSGAIAAIDGTGVAVVEPDAGALSVFDFADITAPELRFRASTCAGGRNVARWNDRVAVSCPDDDRVVVHDASDGGTVSDIEFPWGSRPFGMVADAAGRLLVALQGRGQLAVVDPDDPDAMEFVEAAPDARGVALLPGNRAAVTRWRSPDERGEIAVVDLDGLTPADGITLPFDPVPSSDTETGGVPTYLDSVAVAPSGAVAVVPALQANIGRGEYLDGNPLTFETTLRATLSDVDLDAGTEFFEGRKLFDNRGLASSAVFSPWGDYVYVAMRGSRSVERLDVFSLYSQSGTELNVGFAPDDVALSPDGATVLVHASLSRELVVYDATAFGTGTAPIARLSTVDAEPLDDQILRGKRLFNDSFDPRLAKDSYIACAHCHLDGQADHRTWDFTDRGEGMRNTIALLGRGGVGHGPVHWSANFDEIQDFEHDIRGPFGGLGLMTDGEFHADGRDTTLGTPKSGVSDDLDALAAYVESLTTFPRSPYRAADGSLIDAAERGRVVFESDETGCLECHGGEAMTDSGFVEGEPVLHDVGTMTEASGGRLGGTLPGLDTPTLRGLWNGAPYLHDGSAATLEAVLAANTDDLHGVTSHLGDDEVTDLVAYLLSLE